MDDRRYPAVFVGKRHERDNIWTFDFTTDTPVVFRAGQYAHVKMPDIETDRVRELSIASAPGDDLLKFTVRIRPESLFKQKLDSLKPGDTIEVFKIGGDFTLPEDGTPAVLIGGGIGVTPFRSMLRDALSKNTSAPITFVHVDHPPHVFEEEIKAMPVKQYHIGREEVDATLETVAKTQLESRYFVVGSPAFVEDFNIKLHALGISKEQIVNDDWEY